MHDEISPCMMRYHHAWWDLTMQDDSTVRIFLGFLYCAHHAWWVSTCAIVQFPTYPLIMHDEISPCMMIQQSVSSYGTSSLFIKHDKSPTFNSSSKASWSFTRPYIMKKRTSSSLFRNKFTSFIQDHPKSIFFGTQGGRIYQKYNSVITSPFINNDFFHRYFSTSSRLEKTELQDAIHESLLLDGFQFYTYSKATDSFTVCETIDSRSYLHTYIFNRCVAFKKNQSSIVHSPVVEGNPPVAPFMCKENNNLFLHHDISSSSQVDNSANNDNFNDIPDNFKRYVHHVVRKMMLEYFLSHDHERQLYMDLFNNSNYLSENPLPSEINTDSKICSTDSNHQSNSPLRPSIQRDTTNSAISYHNKIGIEDAIDPSTEFNLSNIAPLHSCIVSEGIVDIPSDPTEINLPQANLNASVLDSAHLSYEHIPKSKYEFH